MKSIIMLSILNNLGLLTTQTFISLIWKSSLLFGVVTLIVFALRNQRASLRHRIWILYILVLPLIPLLSWFVAVSGTPQIEIPVSTEFVISETTAVNDITQPAQTSQSIRTESPALSLSHYPWAIILVVYAIAAVFFLLLVALGRFRLWKWTHYGKVMTDRKIIDVFQKVSEKLNLSRKLRIIEHEDVTVPLTIGTFRPVILLPSDIAHNISDSELDSLAIHEVSHVKRHDSLIFSLMSIIRALLFFHPLVWISAHQVAILAEKACDDAVVENLNDPTTYAEMLTRLAVQLPVLNISTELTAGFIFSRHSFRKRIESILDKRRYKIKALSRPALIGLFATCVLSFLLTVTITSAKEEGVTFQANVIDSQTGKPVKGVRLWHWQHKGIEGTSDTNGHIEIKGMTPGSFEFMVEVDGYARWWSDDAIPEHQRRMISKRDGWQRNFDNLEFNLQTGMKPVKIVVEKGVTIKGRVLDPEGIPVAGATVAPAQTGTGNSITGDTRFSVNTKDDGTYEMLLPASGDAEYNLIAHDGKYQEWRKWANGVTEPFKTKPGETIDSMTISLTKPATVRGLVVDENGKPLANLQVIARPVDLKNNRYYDPESRTDDQGNFILNFISPGENYIQTFPIYPVNMAPEGSIEIVTLKSGEVKDGVKLIGNKKPLLPKSDLKDEKSPKKLRVGVYDNRAIAVAYAHSKYNPVGEKVRERNKARAEGDSSKVKELEAWGEKHQRAIHRQGFGKVPVDDLLEPVKDKFKDLAARTGVDVIALQSDYTGTDVEIVDITDEMVLLYEPSEKTLKIIEEIKKNPPLDLDIIEQNHEH